MSPQNGSLKPRCYFRMKICSGLHRDQELLWILQTWSIIIKTCRNHRQNWSYQLELLHQIVFEESGRHLQRGKLCTGQRPMTELGIVQELSPLKLLPLSLEACVILAYLILLLPQTLSLVHSVNQLNWKGNQPTCMCVPDRHCALVYALDGLQDKLQQSSGIGKRKIVKQHQMCTCMKRKRRFQGTSKILQRTHFECDTSTSGKAQPTKRLLAISDTNGDFACAPIPHIEFLLDVHLSTHHCSSSPPLETQQSKFSSSQVDKVPLFFPSFSLLPGRVNYTPFAIREVGNQSETKEMPTNLQDHIWYMKYPCNVGMSNVLIVTSGK